MKYTDKSIKTMRPLEAIRRRLGMYISGNDNEAVHHVIKEIISNSIDEYINGFGNTIEVTINEKENYAIVKDYGRGIPQEKLDDVWTKVHTSGKLKGENEGAYVAAGGLNGIGGKVATATGKVEVNTIRDSVKASNWYHYEEKGILQKEKTTQQNGTIVKWTPDNDVFTDKQISFKEVEKLLINLSYIASGLTFILNNGNVKTIKADGIEFFLKDNLGKNIYSPILQFDCGDSFLHVEVAMAWSKGANVESSFVNFIPTFEGGTHVSALKTVLTRELNKFLDSNLKGTEIRQDWNYIISVKTTEEPTFKGQQKSALNMPELNKRFHQLYKEELDILFVKEQKFFEKMKEIIYKAREKEKAVAQVRQVLTKASNKINPLPNKLKPALNKKGAELFITEGNSASSSLITYRNIYNQAIMSLRGKPINVKKAKLEKALENQEIQDLIIAMGGFGEDYNSKKCPYDKIFLLADADSDGSHIQNLLITFFFEFYRSLIKENKIYTILTPLYSIKRGTKIEYVFTESEMQQKRKTLPNTAIVSRNKGLGELEPEILARFALSEQRQIIPLTMEDEEKTEQLLEDFMGRDATERREFVKEGKYEIRK